MDISLLVVDDDAIIRESLGFALEQDGYSVTLAGSGEEAVDILRGKPMDVVITDIRMKKMSGFDLLDFVMDFYPEMAVIMVTGYGTIESAVEAMQKGAYDYIVKPVDIEKLNLIVQKAVKIQLIFKENIRLKQELKEKYSFGNMVGKSSQIMALVKDIKYIAATDATVLIQGESGTGKELAANDVHYNSQRAHKPMIKVNCGALSEGVIESELFGHEKGAFTGAIKQQKGRFERADGGTIFLDEVSDLSLSTQVKLLRVLQEGELERVGGSETLKVDARLIAAVNTDLEVLIEQGKFREDLYYRLKVVCLNIPPLRERVDDIPLLTNHFLETFCKAHNKKNKAVTKQALNFMMKYDWKGNIRELRNCVESMVVMSRKPVIGIDDLPHYILTLEGKDDKISIPTGASMKEVEKIIVLKTLASLNGNKPKAAETLGVALKTLYRKLNEYGIQV